AKPSRSAGVWLSRYLSTNAATPRSASARATSQPSFSIDSERKPPPGATITAAPVAFAGSGRNGVSVASVTLRANTLPYWRCQASCCFASGRVPVSSAIALGWSGASITVMVSSWADAAGASAQSTANMAASDTRWRGRATWVERVIVVMVGPPLVWRCHRAPGEHRTGRHPSAAAIRNWSGPITEAEWGTACPARGHSRPGGQRLRVSGTFGHAADQRVVQARHEARATAAECAVCRPRRQPAELASHACAHVDRIGGARDRGAPRQLDPGHRFAIGEMPDPALTVDQQVQACMHQVRHVGRGDGEVARRIEGLACAQCTQQHGHEVVLVPRAEERAGAHHQRPWM